MQNCPQKIFGRIGELQSATALCNSPIRNAEGAQSSRKGSASWNVSQFAVKIGVRLGRSAAGGVTTRASFRRSNISTFFLQDIVVGIAPDLRRSRPSEVFLKADV